MVQLNVPGLLHCAHAALPHLLRAAGDGPRQVADMVNISSVAGRAARNGNGVYSLTKHGAGAFSESLRQEVARQQVRVSVVGPGATATELASHNRPEALESIQSQSGQRMQASDIADAITYIITRPRHVAVNHPAWPAADCLADLAGLQLDDQTTDLFLHGNAERVFGLTGARPGVNQLSTRLRNRT